MSQRAGRRPASGQKFSYFVPDSTSSSHSDMGTYSQSPFSDAVSAAAGVFFFRPRPPREPRRVRFFGFGSSAPFSDGGASTSSSAPSSGPGTWIVGSGGAASSTGAASAAGAFFFRPRPPREPRRVFFFGFSSSAGASSSASAATASGSSSTTGSSTASTLRAGGLRVGFSASPSAVIGPSGALRPTNDAYAAP